MQWATLDENRGPDSRSVLQAEPLYFRDERDFHGNPAPCCWCCLINNTYKKVIDKTPGCTSIQPLVPLLPLSPQQHHVAGSSN
jgi:hypothetical protein